MQLDVPHSTYRPNPTKADGAPSPLTVGSEEPLDAGTLRRLYRDSSDYAGLFNRRLDELIKEGWFLAEDAEDADDLRREAQQVEKP